MELNRVHRVTTAGLAEFVKRFEELLNPICMQTGKETGLSSLAMDMSCQLDVLGHDGDMLGMDHTQISVLKTDRRGGPRSPPAAPSQRCSGIVSWS